MYQIWLINSFMYDWQSHAHDGYDSFDRAVHMARLHGMDCAIVHGGVVVAGVSALNGVTLY